MPRHSPEQKKAVIIAKEIAKIRDNYTCQKCGDKDKQIHGSHILPVTWGKTSAMPDNILALCAGCHKMKKDSWHEDPIANARWFENKYPGEYDRLMRIAVAYSQNPFPKIDWAEVLNDLKEKKRQLLEEKEQLTS